MDITEVLAPVRDLGGYLRAQRVAAQISLRQLARQAGVSNPYLSQVERGLRRPSAEVLAQIAHGLQISVESVLTMAGILDSDTAPPAAVVLSIGADPVLSDVQKASMLEIYHSFRRESERQLAADHAAAGRAAAAESAPAAATDAAAAAPNAARPESPTAPGTEVTDEEKNHVLHP